MTDKQKYMENGMSLTTTKYFKQVDSDPTKTLEPKVITFDQEIT